MLFGVVLNYFIPERVFVYVTSVSLVGTIWTWGMIILAHIGYRRAVARGEAGRSPSACRAALHQLGCWPSSPWSRSSSASTKAPGSRSTSRRSGSRSSGSATSSPSRREALAQGLRALPAGPFGSGRLQAKACFEPPLTSMDTWLTMRIPLSSQ